MSVRSSIFAPQMNMTQPRSDVSQPDLLILVRKWFKSGLKVKGYIFRGRNSAIFIFSSLINIGQLLKEIICSSRSKFFPLRVDPFLGGLCPPGKRTGNHGSCSLL